MTITDVKAAIFPPQDKGDENYICGLKFKLDEKAWGVKGEAKTVEQAVARAVEELWAYANNSRHAAC